MAVFPLRTFAEESLNSMFTGSTFPNNFPIIIHYLFSKVNKFKTEAGESALMVKSTEVIVQKG